MMKEIKNMEWLNNPEFLKNLPLQGNIVSVLEDMMFESILKRIPHVARCADKMKENPYTQVDCLNGIYNFVWEPTRQGKSLTRVDKKLQLNYLSFVMGISGIEEKGMGGSSIGLAGQMIPIPDFIKEKVGKLMGFYRKVWSEFTRIKKFLLMTFKPGLTKMPSDRLLDFLWMQFRQANRWGMFIMML